MRVLLSIVTVPLSRAQSKQQHLRLSRPHDHSPAEVLTALAQCRLRVLASRASVFFTPQAWHRCSALLLSDSADGQAASSATDSERVHGPLFPLPCSGLNAAHPNRRRRVLRAESRALEESDASARLRVLMRPSGTSGYQWSRSCAGVTRSLDASD